nr:4649_t:CDS:1 [Entrophospora candida]
MKIFTVILVLAVISFGIITPSVNAEDVIRYNMTLGFNNQLTSYTCDSGYHLCSDSIGNCCVNGYFCCADGEGGCCPDGTSCQPGYKCSKGGIGGLSLTTTIIIIVVAVIVVLFVISCCIKLCKSNGTPAVNGSLTTRENRRPQTA